MLNHIEEILKIDIANPWNKMDDSIKPSVVDTDWTWDALKKHVAIVKENLQSESLADEFLGMELELYLEWKYTQPHFSKLAVINFLNKWLKYYCITDHDLWCDCSKGKIKTIYYSQYANFGG